MGSLSGKTAIVSGGSDGIGRAIAEKLVYPTQKPMRT